MLTQAQLEKFCAKVDHLVPITSGIKHPIRHEGYIYATNARICIRVVDDGTIQAAPPSGRMKGYDFARLFAGDENANLPIPALPDRIECTYCLGDGLEHDCPACDGEGFIAGDTSVLFCWACGGTGEKPIPFGPEACWWCDGSGEQQDNPVTVGDAYFNRVFLALATEMPGARFVRISSYPHPSLIRFDGGVIAISPTRERKPTNPGRIMSELESADAIETLRNAQVMKS